MISKKLWLYECKNSYVLRWLLKVNCLYITTDDWLLELVIAATLVFRRTVKWQVRRVNNTSMTNHWWNGESGCWKHWASNCQRLLVVRYGCSGEHHTSETTNALHSNCWRFVDAFVKFIVELLLLAAHVARCLTTAITFTNYQQIR